MDVLNLQGSITLDTTAYENALRRAVTQGQQLSSSFAQTAAGSADISRAMSSATASVNTESSSVHNAVQANEQLRDAMRNTIAGSDALRDAMGQGSQTTNETTNTTQSLRERLEGLKEQYNSAVESVSRLRQQYIESVQTTGANSEATRQLGEQLSAASNYTNVLGDEVDYLDHQLNNSRNSSDRFGNSLNAAAVIIGNLMTDAIRKAVSAITDFSKQSIQTGIDFDRSMSQVAATMGVTTDQVQDLRKYAQDMGATTAFSATQAAEALNYMALAGYDSEKSMAMLPNVLNLAAAGGMALGRASDMVTDAQSALGLTMEETTEMVNKMAMASSKSNTSVEQLGDAFLQIGGTAKKLKGGTTELATILGILADNGMKGAEGGTHLRNMMNSLMSPTKDAKAMMSELGISLYDTEGNMRSLNDVFLDLRAVMAEMTTQEERDKVVTTLFNARDMKAAEALLAGVGQRYEELSGYIDEAAESAQNMADTQLDNLAGDITLFQSAVEGAQIAVADRLTPTLRKFTQFGSKAVSEMSEAFRKNGLEGAVTAAHKVIYNELGTKSAVAIYSVEAATKAALAAFVSYQAFVKAAAIEKFFTDAATGAVSLAVGINKAKSAIAALNISPTVAGFTALAAVGVAAASALNAATDAMNEIPISKLTDVQKDAISSVSELNAQIAESRKERESNLKAVTDEVSVYSIMAQKLLQLNDVEDKTIAQKEQMKVFVDSLNNSIEGLNIQYDEQTGKLKTNREEIEKIIQAYKDEARAAAAKEQLIDIYKDQEKAEKNLKNITLQRAGVQNTLSQKQLELFSAEKKLNELREEYSGSIFDAKDGRAYNAQLRYVNSLKKQIGDLKNSMGDLNAAWVNERSTVRSLNEEEEHLTNVLGDVAIKQAENSIATEEATDTQEQAARVVQENLIHIGNAVYTAEGDFSHFVTMIGGSFVTLNEDTAEFVAEQLDYYDELYNKQLETIQKSIDLFSGTETHIDPLDKNELKKNLSDSLFVIEDWGKAIEQLQAKVDAGYMSQDLLNSIKGMDIEDARQYLYMFNRQMSNYELQQYSQMWDEVQAAQAEAAQKATAKEQAEIEENIQKITGAVNASIDDVKTAFEVFGKSGVDSFADSVKANIKKAKNAVSNGSDGLADEVDTAMHDSVLDYGSPSKRFMEYGKWTVSGLAKGIYNNIDMVTDSVNYTGRTATDEMKTVLDIKDSISGKFAELGKNTVEGFAKGIKDNLELATNAVNDLAQKTVDTLKEKFGIASPSKLFRELGGYSGDGFALGFDDSESTVIKAAAGMADSAYNAVGMFEPSNYTGTTERPQSNVQSVSGAAFPETLHITLMLQSGQVLAEALFPFMDMIQGREVRLSARGY